MSRQSIHSPQRERVTRRRSRANTNGQRLTRWQEKLRGVPAVPDEYAIGVLATGEDEPPDELQKKCNASIEAACAEIRRRNGHPEPGGADE